MRSRAGAEQHAALLLVVSLVSVVVGCARPAEPGETDWRAEGPIQVIDGRTWVVDGQLVTVAPDATIVGSPAVGAVARLVGLRSRTGQLVARHVEIAQPVQPTAPAARKPTAQPIAKPTVRPAVKPTAKPTAQPAPPPRPPAVRGDRDDEDDD
jgi:outer membrane biosynthesis protein TonB